MPTFNSAVYTAQSSNHAWPSQQDVQAKLRYATVAYALVGTETAADIINLAILPRGAKVIPSLSRVVCEDPGTALTVDIGFASNDDALADGLALTTAHDVAFTANGTATAAQYAPAALAAGDERIFATVKTATDLTASAKLLFQIAYLEP